MMMTKNMLAVAAASGLMAIASSPLTETTALTMKPGSPHRSPQRVASPTRRVSPRPSVDGKEDDDTSMKELEALWQRQREINEEHAELMEKHAEAVEKHAELMEKLRSKSPSPSAERTAARNSPLAGRAMDRDSPIVDGVVVQDEDQDLPLVESFVVQDQDQDQSLSGNLPGSSRPTSGGPLDKHMTQGTPAWAQERETGNNSTGSSVEGRNSLLAKKKSPAGKKSSSWFFFWIKVMIFLIVAFFVVWGGFALAQDISVEGNPNLTRFANTLGM